VRDHPVSLILTCWTTAIGTDVNSHSISSPRNGSISESWFESFSGGSLDEASEADTKLTKSFSFCRIHKTRIWMASLDHSYLQDDDNKS
jgi:hypothetical protein